MSRNTGQSSRIKRSPAKNYKIYGVNVHGSGLSAIRQVYMEKVQTGQRRTLFAIDLQAELLNMEETLAERTTRGQIRTTRRIDPVFVALSCIDACRKKFEHVQQSLEQEKKFNLYEYWLNEPGDIDIGKKPKAAVARKSDAGSKTKKSTREKPVDLETATSCMKILPREHNRVGRPKKLIHMDFINDSLWDTKLLIIIFGNINTKFIDDLIAYKEPLQAVVDYLPEIGVWDSIMQNVDIEKFLIETLANIQTKYLELRHMSSTKPVGLFKYSLPVISICLARNNANEIFNQLTWYFYDLELLFEYYLQYYYNAFHVINVSMSDQIKIQHLYNTLNALSMQGHFMLDPLPVACNDLASLAIYLECIINNVTSPHKNTTELSNLLTSASLTRSVFDARISGLSVLTTTYQNAFISLMKIDKYERIIVEKANQLLHELIQYCDHQPYSNIYVSCLEYNILRHYALQDCNKMPHMKFTENSNNKYIKPRQLPKYVRFLSTEDSTLLKLTQMLYDYDDYEILEIHNNHRLYCFRRVYDEIFEKRSLTIIPTRLCYRDFTIFQLEEFQENFREPPIIYGKSVGKSFTRELQKHPLRRSIDLNIFIRPNALKLRKRLASFPTPVQDLGKKSKSSISEQMKFVQSNTRKPSSSSYEIYGLPANHKLLKGYNLEDVRQEIQVYTARYHFEEGYIELYEEYWCFTTMNKMLNMNIHGNRIKLVCPLNAESGIMQHLHIITKNQLQVRICALNEETCKIVINYPNGLIIHKYEGYIEQSWCKDKTPTQELRRIHASCGAVIVYNEVRDVVTVMRYNGEVYELYNHEITQGEEEEEQMEEVVQMKNNAPKEKRDRSQVSQTLSQNDQYSQEESSENLAERERLVRVLISELNFIDNVCKDFKLTYLHMIITTTMGRVIHLTQSGRIFETRTLKNIEWHDYFANEHYASREDKVKRIWTANSLKCFHKDGTIITTSTEESEIVIDEFDFISTSSSHFGEELENSPEDLTKSRASQSYKEESFDCRYEEEFEEIKKPEEDAPFVTYRCDSFLHQHKNFAEIIVMLIDTFESDLRVHMEIFGYDRLRAYVNDEDFPISESVEEIEAEFESKNSIDDHKTSESVKYPRVELDFDATKNQHVHVCFDNCISINCNQNACELSLLLAHDSAEDYVCDTFKFKFDFNGNVKEIFEDLTMDLSRFKNYSHKKAEEHFILEKLDQKGHKQGFEFLEELPTLSKFHHAVSNTITEFTEVTMMDNKFANVYKWYKDDMKKFVWKRYEEPIEELPVILGVNIYVKVPTYLTFTKRIHKFLEPFTNLNYKRTRQQINEALITILNPSYAVRVHKLYSKNSWRIHHRWHQHRLIVEEQRKGLYFAMLKFKKYPNYFDFYEKYEGHVRNIDFFEFVQYQCLMEPSQASELH